MFGEQFNQSIININLPKKLLYIHHYMHGGYDVIDKLHKQKCENITYNNTLPKSLLQIIEYDYKYASYHKYIKYEKPLIDIENNESIKDDEKLTYNYLNYIDVKKSNDLDLINFDCL